MAGPMVGAVLAGGLEGYAKGSAQNLAVGSKAMTDQYLQEVQALMNERIAERSIQAQKEAGDTQYQRELGFKGIDAATRADEASKQHGYKLEEIKATASAAKESKPTYPKLIKLKDENDREYLIDQNTGARGDPVSESAGLPAKSHWFSQDEPAVPATKSGIKWTASDGTELPGGLAELYNQIKKPGGKQPTSFDPAMFDPSVKKAEATSTPPKAKGIISTAHKPRASDVVAEARKIAAKYPKGIPSRYMNGGPTDEEWKILDAATEAGWRGN